ncbi:DUF378 domain-containing protein [Patescibacteria group bacterium]|nr:DUF378 domain-containing protein [Patescibacteria group bacterium]MBU1683525.1 DUF378 domain-containing protein [Patescibacteria group bacterium]MBU1935023.1 DUF378 domain-containing protein [Patescibacteria group bacterium]
MKALTGIMVLLTVVGGINWGLVALGYFLNTNLNVVNLLLGTWPMVEMIVYLLVGLSALVVGYAHLTKKCSMCTHS